MIERMKKHGFAPATNLQAAFGAELDTGKTLSWLRAFWPEQGKLGSKPRTVALLRETYDRGKLGTPDAVADA
jgi:hypothetical protein